MLAVLVSACSEHEPNHISVHSKKADENKKDPNNPVKHRKARSHKNIRV